MKLATTMATTDHEIIGLIKFPTTHPQHLYQQQKYLRVLLTSVRCFVAIAKFQISCRFHFQYRYMHMHMATEGEELVREYAVSISAVHEVYLIIH